MDGLVAEHSGQTEKSEETTLCRKGAWCDKGNKRRPGRLEQEAEIDLGGREGNNSCSMRGDEK